MTQATTEGAGAEVSTVANIAPASDADVIGEIRKLEKQRKDSGGKLSDADQMRLHDLTAMKNRRDQIRRRDDTRASLKVAAKIRGNAAARKLLNTMFKETLALVLKDDAELKGKSALAQVQAMANDAASEDGLKRLEATFESIRTFVRAAPALATRELMLEGNVPAVDVLLSTVGVRPSTKAVDRDIDTAIAVELRDEAAEQPDNS